MSKARADTSRAAEHAYALAKIRIGGRWGEIEIKEELQRSRWSLLGKARQQLTSLCVMLEVLVSDCGNG